MQENPSHPEVIIIGAGLAGLTVALHLAERGIKPLVLEADSRAGGRLSGGEQVEIAGTTFSLEHGVHGIWAQYRNFNAMLARNNLRPVLVPARDETWVYRHNRFTGMAPIGASIRRSFIPAPFHYLNLFFNIRFLMMLDIRDWAHLFHVWGGLVFALGVDPLVENQLLTGLTLGGLTRRWSPALRAMFQGLARNALSAHPDQVPLSGFLAFLRFYTLLRRDSWAFSYLPEQSAESLIGPLVRRLQSLGGKIQINRKVEKLTIQPDGWTVHSGDQVFTTKQVILAVESSAAEKILAPLQNDELFFPRSTANAIIRLWFSAQPKSGSEAGMFSGEFSGHNFFWLSQIYNQYMRWARETGGSALEIHVYGPPETLAQPDAILLAQILQEVTSVWPELRGARLGQHIQRNPASHTLPAVGPQEKHPGTQPPWPGLFCAGDWVRHPSPSFFMERAVVTGIAAANHALKARNLQEWPLLASLPPEPLAAGIENLMRKGRKRIRQGRMEK